MIFVTVGTQHPYDRLVLTIDRWAAAAARSDVFAQIGNGGQKPSHIEWAHMLPPAETTRRITNAELVVSHAGTGTILTALNMGTPVVVMPRREDMSETRGAHQMATAKHLRGHAGILVADDEHALVPILDRVLSGDHSTPLISAHASEELLGAIREFIGQGS